MRGFDPEYTDIVDYIVRCTHRIWDERNVGLIYSHYTHNAVVYTPLGTVYDREDVVRATIQRIAEFPDRRGMATQVIWRGDENQGFYTSHLVTSTGRHTEPGPLGPPTGRPFVMRTIADCMVFENRIYREWLVRDNYALFRQLGIDIGAQAERTARDLVAGGAAPVNLGETGHRLGQYPPAAECDLSMAHTDGERDCLRWLHELWNRRMFGHLQQVCAPGVRWHGPGMMELTGVASLTTQVIRLAAMIPDLAFTPLHICSLPCEEGGEKIAVRWIMHGHHLGWGALGAPTGAPLVLMGMNHFHVQDGQVVDDWTVYDLFSLMVQVRVAALLAQSMEP
jgi:predicted ester cyclase